MSTAQEQIVARRENRSPNLPKKTWVVIPAAPKFRDADHWDELAATYLSSYDLPAWNVPCDHEAMARWLDRLDIPLGPYLRTSGLRNLAEFVTLNTNWPLRAFVGLALELKNKGGHDDAG